MAIGCGPKIAKFILFVFNVLFWISGLILIIIGSIYVATGGFKNLDEIIQPNDRFLRRLMIIVIVLGFVIFIIGFFGCCGAIRESRLLLGIYIGLLFFIIIAEVICGVFAAIKNREILEKIGKRLQKSMKKHYPPEGNSTNYQSLKVSVDWIQKSFECCGVSGYKDWENSTWYETRDRIDVYKETPVSCCRSESDEEIRQCFNEQKYYRNGCQKKVENYVKSRLRLVIGVLIGIVLFEILVACFGICLCKNTGNVEHSAI